MKDNKKKKNHGGESPSVKKEQQEFRLVLFCDGKISEFVLSGNQVLGRRTSANFPDIAVESLIVSRTHGEFNTKDGRIEYCDTGSKNGTYIDGHKISVGKPVELKDGAVLQIQAEAQTDSFRDVLLIVEKRYPERVSWKKISLVDRANKVTVGRGDEITIQDRTASRHHASFILAKNGWAIADNNSLNGVYLNGRRIPEPVLLKPLDVVRIAKHLFIFQEDEIFYQADEEVAERNLNSSALIGQDKEDGKEKAEKADSELPQDSAEGLNGKVTPGDIGENHSQDILVQQKRDNNKRRPAKGRKILSIHIEERIVWNHLRKKVILKDIDISVESGSMVLILGGSGSGKTTFMNAVMGYEPAKGFISYGGFDIYRDYEKMKYEIGYVPQQDLLRMEDVVYDTLENAARMRLPEDVFLSAGERYVEYTLNLFGLIRERNVMVGKLSGGQRKRLSIAVEYIGNPSLFFLDEPDSGLDGIMAKELMMNLRQIADQGKIVMVITHSPDRVFEQFDKVVVLAKSGEDDCGHLVYYGAPADACGFFGTKSLEEIVGRVNRKDEGGQGLADIFIKKFRKERGGGR